MSSNIEQYKAFLTEVIAKQAVILGSDIAVLKARSVEGLVINDDGTVDNISGDPARVSEQLLDTYVQLSGQIVKNALSSVFSKYPDLLKGKET